MNAIPGLDLLRQRRNRWLNTVHTWLLAAGSLLLLAVTAWIFAGGAGIVYALIFGGVSMWMVRRLDPKIVLSMYKARPVSRSEFPGGLALIEELSRRAGLPAAPKLYAVPSKLMNAFAVGRRDDAAIAITEPLVRNLTGRELAGVLAHEISHIAHEDVKVMAFADMVSRFTSFMSTVGIFSLALNVLGFAGGYDAQVPWTAVLLLIFAPTIGGLLQLALSRTREFDADLGAAILTGDPDGLASALVKLEKAQGIYWESLMLPSSRTPVPSVLRTHPETAERVARLDALKRAGAAPESPVALEPGGRVVVPRRSFIPPAGRRMSADDYRRIASLMGAVQPIPESTDAGTPRLDPPLGNPRVRVRRGGVYW